MGVDLRARRERRDVTNDDGRRVAVPPAHVVHPATVRVIDGTRYWVCQITGCTWKLEVK